MVLDRFRRHVELKAEIPGHSGSSGQIRGLAATFEAWNSRSGSFTGAKLGMRRYGVTPVAWYPMVPGKEEVSLTGRSFIASGCPVISVVPGFRCGSSSLALN